ISSNLAFLTSISPHVSERHRSMRAVFDASWLLLSQDERTVFARLSVFRSGFQHPAAAHVAGAQLATLMALVDKSLLRWEPGDRYRIHELLRQYAAERLEQLDDEAARAPERHCAYYADFLARRAADIVGRRQREALLEIASELENVRAAWDYALQHRRIAEIQRAAYTFYMFHDYSSRYQEEAELFATAVRLLDVGAPTSAVGPTLAELLVCLGWTSIRLGQLERARQTLERSQFILTRLAIAPRPGPGTDPLTALGTLACVQGDYAEAARLGVKARQQGEARADEANLMYAHYVLTSAAFAQGQYAEARRSGERACALAERVGDRWFMAYLLANLGHIARATGDYPEARRQYQLSYAIREEFDDPEGMAVALTHLGQVALLQRDPAVAAAQFQRSLAIYRAIDDRGGIATALEGLGRSAAESGVYDIAARHFHEALQTAIAIGFVPRTHAILTGVAELLLLIGAAAQAAGLLVAILRHPASDRETSDRARSLLDRCVVALAPSAYVAATQGRQTIDLAAISASLQAAVDEVSMERATGQKSAQVSVAPGAVLAEPLTERELAVLRLLAEGQSNREISDRLIISLGTTKWYVSQIFGKLGVHSRTQAITRAREISLLT
ncbi:MAG TPA: tetratricopeptide repeat protein, partial [Roseiflexaceae bacterium]|nr:tetratricopeptide repeat protein [Roseiflexaceae bacterium]